MNKVSFNPPGVDRLLDEVAKFGSGIGLHRMLEICGEVVDSNWFRSLDAVRITGSNGKGSTTAMVASILSHLQIDVGQYTSPHLVRFNERIRCAGVEITDDEAAIAIDWFTKQSTHYQLEHPNDTIGAFEAITAIALYHFLQKKPDTLVLEAGIGGRYDSTRMIPGTVTGLTSLDLEHTEVLGNTLELIAYDKADLCPDGGILVCGPIDPETKRRLASYCRIRNVTLIDAAAELSHDVREVSCGRTIVDFATGDMRLPGVEVALVGEHQIQNAAVAILIARHWARRNRPGVSDSEFSAAVRRGLATVVWNGRFEQVHKNPNVYIDVGHSPAAVDAVVRTASAVCKDRNLLLVTGVSYDKEVEQIVSRLATVADFVVCTRAYHKGSEVSRVAKIARSVRPDISVIEAPTIEEAMSTACDLAIAHDMDILVAGGLFLSIEAVQSLQGNDPRKLRFF